MTLKEIANKLIAQGVDVRFRARKDGSIRITSIGGAKFKGSEGNALARAMVGEKLSARRAQQLKSRGVATPKGQFGHKKSKKLQDEELRKQLKRVQRFYRNRGITTGSPTMRNVRYTLEKYGLEEAKERLAQAERYAKGLAYPVNLEHFVKRLELDRAKMKSNDYQLVGKIIDYISAKIHSEQIYEEQLSKLIEVLYEMEKETISVQDWLSKSLSILTKR